MATFPDGLGQMREANLPLRFRIDTDTREHAAETIAVSPEHFIIRSPIELVAGQILAIKVRVPVELSGTPFGETKFTGRIVCGTKHTDGKFGYVVKIERPRED